MDKNIEAVAEAAAVFHLQQFTAAIADAVNNFVDVFDPSESEEFMTYVRKVLAAADNLVIVACLQEENEEAIKQLRESNDIKIQQLIDKANADKETH